MSKSISGLHDPYEDQLAAARYRAERDQARQELERERHLRKLAESAAAERDTVRAEDHEAAAWVRDNGGLAKVQALRWLGAECASIVTGEDGCEDYLEADDAAYALRRRLMPEGMEWPRYEDGEPFVPGDDGSVEFFGDGIFNVWINGDHQHLVRGERVKRPSGIAADGEPLEDGQTVFGVDDGKEFVVVRPLCSDGLVLLKCGTKAGGYVYTSTEPEHLTHTKPEQDSWERWRSEFMRPPCVYCRDILGVDFDNDTELDRAFDAQIQDMERRAKALAESGE